MMCKDVREVVLYFVYTSVRSIYVHAILLIYDYDDFVRYFYIFFIRITSSYFVRSYKISLKKVF